MITRRNFVAMGAVAGLAACARPDSPAPAPAPAPAPEPAPPPLPAHYGPIPDERFPIPAIEPGTLPPKFWRKEVPNPWPGHARGTIVVDPNDAQLHFVESPETAMRYACSVGAAGFAWQGKARLQFMREWPRWKVPDSMIERNPELEPYSVANGGMEPGLDNALGSRALYLFQNGEDTLYRIHGNGKPWELGRAVSSGCIRMLDHDVIDLHDRAVHGADVIVLPSMKPDELSNVY